MTVQAKETWTASDGGGHSLQNAKKVHALKITPRQHLNTKKCIQISHHSVVRTIIGNNLGVYEMEVE